MKEKAEERERRIKVVSPPPTEPSLIITTTTTSFFFFFFFFFGPSACLDLHGPSLLLLFVSPFELDHLHHELSCSRARFNGSKSYRQDISN